jgi:hypothetical protein
MYRLRPVSRSFLSDDNDLDTVKERKKNARNIFVTRGFRLHNGPH